MELALFAGLLVTLSLIVLIAQVLISEQKPDLPGSFLFFYGSGTFLWAILGLYQESVPLVSISLVQLSCVVGLKFLSKRIS